MNRYLDRIKKLDLIKLLTFVLYATGFIGMAFFSFKIGDIHLFPYRLVLPFIWILIIVSVIKNQWK